MKSTLGIDEAGRGAVIGPMVVAGITSSDVKGLRALGVDDSKNLTRPRRFALERDIIKHCTGVYVKVVSHEEINSSYPSRNLNDLTFDRMSDILRESSFDRAIVDACDSNTQRMRARLAAESSVSIGRIECKKRADEEFPEVMAASILAKCERDRLMARIAVEWPDFELGYPTPAVRAAIARYLDEYGAPPPYSRKHWKTFQPTP